jgi:hypothetical protein
MELVIFKWNRNMAIDIHTACGWRADLLVRGVEVSVKFFL